VEYTPGNRLFRIVRPGELGSAARVEFVAGAFWQPDSKRPLPPQTMTDPREVRFNGLHDVAVGTTVSVYVADTFANRLWAFNPKQNTLTVLAGNGRAGFSGDGGPAVDAELKQAYCSSLTPDGTALLVTDTENHCIRRYDPAKETIDLVAGVPGRGGRRSRLRPWCFLWLTADTPACEPNGVAHRLKRRTGPWQTIPYDALSPSCGERECGPARFVFRALWVGGA